MAAASLDCELSELWGQGKAGHEAAPHVAIASNFHTRSLHPEL